MTRAGCPCCEGINTTKTSDMSYQGQSERIAITGNQAVAWAVLRARTQVVAAYPITPQTSIVEEIAEFCANGMMEAKFIQTESEHSSMAACIGASMSGARAFTATSSQGLALMHEMLHWATGARTPVVLGEVNRSLAAPWTILTDQSDSCLLYTSPSPRD